MKTDIRGAEANDRAALFTLVRAFPSPTPTDHAAFAAAFGEKIKDAASFIGVAEHEDGLVGYISGYRHVTFYAGGPTAWIDELFVDTLHRQQGIGRGLVAAFEDWAFGHGCRLVGLATAGAAAFYQRLGYQSRAGYYKKYAKDGADGDSDQRSGSHD